MSDRPNILWLCTDQQRWDTLGCYGDPFVRTPHLDALAETSLNLTRAVSTCPVSARPIAPAC